MEFSQLLQQWGTKTTPAAPPARPGHETFLFDDVVSFQRTSAVFKGRYVPAAQTSEVVVEAAAVDESQVLALKVVDGAAASSLHHEFRILEHLHHREDAITSEEGDSNGCCRRIPKAVVFSAAYDVAEQTKAAEGTSDVLHGHPMLSTASVISVLGMTFFKAAPLHRMFTLPPHRFSESATATIIRQVVHLLLFLHSKGVVYADVKLPNVLLDTEGQVVFVDFGSAFRFTPSDDPIHGVPVTEFQRMTPHVSPPEVSGGLERHRIGGEADETNVAACVKHPFFVDFFSVGVLAVELLTGKPFLGALDAVATAAMLKAERDRLRTAALGWHIDTVDFVVQLLSPEPTDRCKGDIREHPFLRRGEPLAEDLLEEVEMQTLGL